MAKDWTVHALKEHTNKLFKSFGKGADYRFKAIKQAIKKADGYAAYRDAKQNEFQGALNDAGKRADEQAKQFASKTDVQNLDKQFNIWMDGMNRRIDKAERAVETIQNIKRGSAAIWPWVITIIMTLTTMGLLMVTFMN